LFHYNSLFVTSLLYSSLRLSLSLFVTSLYIQTISIAPLKANRYSESLPTQHGCVKVWRRSATGNCKWRTCPRSLRGS